MAKFIVAAVRAEVVCVEVEAANEDAAREAANRGDGDEVPDHPSNGPVVALDLSSWEVTQLTCSLCDVELAESEDVACGRCRDEDDAHQQEIEEQIADGERRYAIAVLGDEAPDWRA